MDVRKKRAVRENVCHGLSCYASYFTLSVAHNVACLVSFETCVGFKQCCAHKCVIMELPVGQWCSNCYYNKGSFMLHFRAVS